MIMELKEKQDREHEMLQKFLSQNSNNPIDLAAAATLGSETHN